MEGPPDVLEAQVRQQKEGIWIDCTPSVSFYTVEQNAHSPWSDTLGILILLCGQNDCYRKFNPLAMCMQSMFITCS
jgi:hypothetical protein